MNRKFIITLAVALLLSTPIAAQAVGIGDKAPLFSAASDKGEINLKDYLGERNVILSFYFAINTAA